MEAIIQNIIELLKDIVGNSNYLVSLFTGIFIIVLESVIPVLPLALFIAINILVFGNLVGFCLSWFATILGCSLSFAVFRILKNKIQPKLKKRQVIEKCMDKVGHMKFSNLVILLSIPFTPAFSINIGAGLSNMKYIKYLFALIISKIFLVYFWGYVGTTFVDSITDIGILLKLGSMIIIAFVLSKIVMYKFDID